MTRAAIALGSAALSGCGLDGPRTDGATAARPATPTATVLAPQVSNGPLQANEYS